MFEWFDSLTVLQKVFAAIGGGAGLIFLIQLVMMFIGGDGGDGDVDGVDTDFDTDMDGVHADSDIGFKLLSMQSLTTFLMMFGLSGLATSKGGYGALISFGVGAAIGTVFMYIVAKAFALFRSLQNSGTIDLKNAVGQYAKVYLTIKPDHPGQIEVAVQGHLGIYDAMSKNKIEIPTGEKVKVVEVLNNTMIVEKA